MSYNPFACMASTIESDPLAGHAKGLMSIQNRRPQFGEAPIIREHRGLGISESQKIRNPKKEPCRIGSLFS